MKISVLTPSYNSEKYLRKSIESVLAQSYENWEHIIVDGNSQDGTVDILREYEHIIWISEVDKGQSDAMNKAFKMATGDIIVYLNSDDYFYPKAFKTIIEEFQNNEKVDIIVGNLNVFKNGVHTLSDNATTKWKDLAIIRGRFPLNPVSYFYKREVQKKIGDFPIDEHYTMDYWFLLRAFYLFETVKIEKILGCFVFDGNNKTSLIVDGFDIQLSHALKFSLLFTPLRTPYVIFKLLSHHRNNSGFSKNLRSLLKILRRIRNKLSLNI